MVVKAAISALDDAYTHIFTTQLKQSGGRGVPWLLFSSSSLTAKASTDQLGDDDADKVLQEYHCWMRDTYVSCREQLLCLLLHPNQTLAVREMLACLCACLCACFCECLFARLCACFCARLCACLVYVAVMVDSVKRTRPK